MLVLQKELLNTMTNQNEEMINVNKDAVQQLGRIAAAQEERNEIIKRIFKD